MSGGQGDVRTLAEKLRFRRANLGPIVPCLHSTYVPPNPVALQLATSFTHVTGSSNALSLASSFPVRPRLAASLLHRHRCRQLPPMTPYLSTCRPHAQRHPFSQPILPTPKSTTPSTPEDAPLDTEPLTEENVEQLNQETSGPAPKAEKRIASLRIWRKRDRLASMAQHAHSSQKRSMVQTHPGQ